MTKLRFGFLAMRFSVHFRNVPFISCAWLVTASVVFDVCVCYLNASEPDKSDQFQDALDFSVQVETWKNLHNPKIHVSPLRNHATVFDIFDYNNDCETPIIAIFSLTHSISLSLPLVLLTIYVRLCLTHMIYLLARLKTHMAASY